MSTYAELRLQIAEAAGVEQPHESERWPRWVMIAARTVTKDPREMLTREKTGAIVVLLGMLRVVGPGVQEALVAADALGGDRACVDFVDAFLRERGI